MGGEKKIMKKQSVQNIVSKSVLLLVAFIWGSGFVAAQIALDSGISPFYMMTFRFSIASVVLCICFRRSMKINFKKHLLPGVILGFFMFVAFALQTIGLQYTTPSKNAFLTATNVIVAPFIFWIIFKNSPSISIFSGALIALLGVGIISLDISNISINRGDTLTLLCAIFFAFHIVYIGYYTKTHGLDPIKLVVLQMCTATILSILSAFLFETYHFTITYKSIGAVLYLGFFSTLLAFLLQNIAQKYVISTTTAIILSTESLFGTLMSVLLLDDIITYKLVIGGIFILVAIIITETPVLKRCFLKIKGK